MNAEPRTRWEPDQRKAQILARAREIFRERSYETVTGAEIARSAGVSRALLNHYFGSKRELYLEVLRGMLEVPPVPVPEYVAGEGPAERVAQSVDGWLELLERNRETWLCALGIASSAIDDEVAAIVDASRERSVDRIIAVTGLRALVREHPEVHGVLRGFSGMAEATTREWLGTGRLSRAQVQVLLEGTLLTIITDLVPRVVDAG